MAQDQKQRTSNVDRCGKRGKVKCQGNSRSGRYSRRGTSSAASDSPTEGLTKPKPVRPSTGELWIALKRRHTR
jgi:hypothetical protein